MIDNPWLIESEGTGVTTTVKYNGEELTGVADLSISIEPGELVMATMTILAPRLRLALAHNGVAVLKTSSVVELETAAGGVDNASVDSLDSALPQTT